ncbi:MAG: hypothetical protein KBA51_06035 [Kiritimatiellae bacterium]|nr:hypothetical protein [Kiritimatiellia bacterium]
MVVQIGGSWDGESSDDGPDALIVRLDDGRVLMHTTFSSSGEQSFPERIRIGSHRGQAGTVVLKFAVPHTAERMALVLNAELNERLRENRHNIYNERWFPIRGRIELVPAPLPRLEESAFEQIWEDLRHTDAGTAWAAVDRLILSDPDSFLPLIGKKLDELERPDADGGAHVRISKLVAVLDRGMHRDRARAARELSEISPVHISKLQKAITPELSLEARIQLEEIIAVLQQDGRKSNYDYQRLRRVRYALLLIPGPESRALLDRITE